MSIEPDHLSFSVLHTLHIAGKTMMRPARLGELLPPTLYSDAIDLHPLTHGGWTFGLFTVKVATANDSRDHDIFVVGDRVVGVDNNDPPITFFAQDIKSIRSLTPEESSHYKHFGPPVRSMDSIMSASVPEQALQPV